MVQIHSVEWKEGRERKREREREGGDRVSSKGSTEHASMIAGTYPCQRDRPRSIQHERDDDVQRHSWMK